MTKAWGETPFFSATAELFIKSRTDEKEISFSLRSSVFLFILLKISEDTI